MGDEDDIYYSFMMASGISYSNYSCGHDKKVFVVSEWGPTACLVGDVKHVAKRGIKRSGSSFISGSYGSYGSLGMSIVPVTAIYGNQYNGELSLAQIMAIAVLQGNEQDAMAAARALADKILEDECIG